LPILSASHFSFHFKGLSYAPRYCKTDALQIVGFFSK
jgi:hypothetical protein